MGSSWKRRGTLRRRKVLAALALAGMLGVLLASMCVGCSVILPSHARALDDQAGNAVAVNTLVQGIAVPTAEEWVSVKLWIMSDAKAWSHVAEWAHSREPAPIPARSVGGVK
jgi:hypothetical protein